MNQKRQSKSSLPNLLKETELNNQQKALLVAFKSANDFVIEFDLDNLVKRYVDIKTPLEALRSKKIKLYQLPACYGFENVKDWLTFLLASYCKFMDFEVDEDRVKMTGILLYDDIYMMNLAEISLFFRGLQRGVYGTMYKFNGPEILKSAREYRQKRGVELARLSETEQKELI